MSIRLVCVCGRTMALPEKYSGQHVECPACHAMLRIPTPEEDLSLTRWVCSCGQRLKARSRTGGRKLRCPKCSSEVSVPFPDGHSTFVEENFMLDDESGIVQRVPEMPRGDPQPAEKAGPPVAEPPVKNLLSASAPERGGKQAPAASKAGPPTPEPEPVLDGDDDVTRINPRSSPFLGEMGRMPAKRGTGDVYEVATGPPAPPDRVRPRPVQPAKPAPKSPQPAMAAQASEEEVYAQEVEAEAIPSPELLSDFNTKTGVEAAKAAAQQVLKGYWLYIPYALLAVVHGQYRTTGSQRDGGEHACGRRLPGAAVAFQHLPMGGVRGLREGRRLRAQRWASNACSTTRAPISCGSPRPL